MLFPERPKNLPYLAEYLNHAMSVRLKVPSMPNMGIEMIGSAAVGTLVGVVTTLAASGAQVVAGVVAGICAFAISAVGAIRYAKAANTPIPLSEDLQLQKDAREVVVRMHALLQKRRLHRDLSPDVGGILEEAACQWSRARSALLSPYWNRPELSLHTQTVRQQTLAAADRGMQEMIVLLGTTVPEQPGSWNLAEVVDEVVGKNVFASAPLHRFSPFFEDGVRLVERLKDLADESEFIARQLVSDPDIGSVVKPGTSLEATLADLRSLRQAEDELREDLHN